ncbi:hypothetical protein BH11PSE6_BH11PSE6_01680 [soil metagenome]
MSVREFSLAVVGLDYPNADKAKSSRRFEVALCRPGDPVEMRREPGHRQDENAVAVFSERGIQLGYLASARAAFVSRQLKEHDAFAVFQSPGGNVAYIRVRFGGGAPSLPPDKSLPLTDTEFIADPPGPEWGA